MSKANPVTLARLTTGRCSSLSERKHRFGAVTALLGALFAAGVLRVVATEQNPGSGSKPVQVEPTVGVTEPTAPHQYRGIAPSAGGKNQVALFLGYVEFDWDPATPGGVPGFGPWLSATAAASRMEN